MDMHQNKPEMLQVPKIAHLQQSIDHEVEVLIAATEHPAMMARDQPFYDLSVCA